MSYNILGITPGHNGAAALVSDGKLVYYLEEERMSRLKRDGNPFRVIIDICSKYKIDELVLAGVNYQSHLLFHTGEDMFLGLVRKIYPKVKFKTLFNNHHLSHSFSSFYNSGFTKAISVVIDGNGSKNNHVINNKDYYSDEIQSIYIHEYPLKIYLYNSTQLCNSLKNNYSNKELNIINTIGIGKAYEAISEYLGFGRDGGGKTMGLSSYGSFNLDIPTFLQNNFIYTYHPREDIQEPNVKTGILDNYLPEDIAYKVQQESQQIVGDYIEEAIKETGLKQVCCSGGYFLNCVANYYLKKRFPNVKFYFEPMSNDAGTAIGVAKWAWHSHTQDKTIRPQKTLYYGPQYSKKQLIEGIKKYV